MLKVFITNLGMYNEGILCGEWIELPIEEEDLNEVLDKLKFVMKMKTAKKLNITILLAILMKNISLPTLKLILTV